MKKVIILVLLLVCSNVWAGGWTSYDYGTGTYTTGTEHSWGTGNNRTTVGTTYNHITGDYGTYTVTRTGNNTRVSSYDYGTNSYSTTNLWD